MALFIHSFFFFASLLSKVDIIKNSNLANLAINIIKKHKKNSFLIIWKFLLFEATNIQLNNKTIGLDFFLTDFIGFNITLTRQGFQKINCVLSSKVVIIY